MLTCAAVSIPFLGEGGQREGSGGNTVLFNNNTTTGIWNHSPFRGCLAEITTKPTLLDVERNRGEDTSGSECNINRKRTNRQISQDEKQRMLKHFLQTPLNIFLRLFSLFLLQERYRSRTARKPTKGSTSAWPPTLKACATPPPQTYMCEVGPEHTTHMHVRTHTCTETTHKNHYC